MIKKVFNKIVQLHKQGLFFVFAGNILNKIFAFVSSMVIVRLVTKEDYAYLTCSDNIYAYITLFAGLGMANALLKYASSSCREKNKAYLKFSMKYGTIFQVFLVAAILLVVQFRSDLIPFPGAKSLILLYCLHPILEYWLNVMYAVVRANLKNKLYVGMSVIQTSIVMTLGIGAVLLLGIQGIIWARYVALVLAISLGLWFVKKEYSKVETYHLTKTEIKTFMSMAISLLVANIFSLILPLNETLLVNTLIQDEIVTANYKVATMLPAQLPFITNSIVVFYFPIIARMEDKKQAWKLTKKVGLCVFAGVVGISCIAAIFAGPIIRIFYGDGYADAIGMSRIFWIVYSFNAGVRMLPVNMLPAIGKTRYNVIVSALSCVVHFILDYVLIKHYGISGVAFATAIVYLGAGLAYWYFLRKECYR